MTSETPIFNPVLFASKDLNISVRQVAAEASVDVHLTALREEKG